MRDALCAAYLAGRGRRSPAAVAALALASALIAGCAQLHVGTPEAAKPSTPSAGQARSGGHELEALHLQRARGLEVEGRWGEAAAHWEVLSLLAPENDGYRSRREQARSRARSESDALLQAAGAARRRGDSSAAHTAYLRALAADPGNPAAASALRDLEFERNRGLYLKRHGTPSEYDDRTPNAGDKD